MPQQCSQGLTCCRQQCATPDSSHLGRRAHLRDQPTALQRDEGGNRRRLGIASPGAPLRAAGLGPVSRWGSGPASARTSRQLGLLACPAIYLVISARASRRSGTSWQQQLSQMIYQLTQSAPKTTARYVTHNYSPISSKCSKLLITHK